MRTLYMCGAGNSEGVRLALALNRHTPRWERIVILDDNEALHGQNKIGVEIVGAFDMLAEADPEADQAVNLVTRTTRGRRGARTRIASFGIPFTSLISPEIDTFGVEFAEDLTAYPNAFLGPEAIIDEGCVLLMGALAGHECIVGPHCVLAAGSVLNARVRLGEGVYVGTNATILPEITVGDDATIGAGSTVIQNVPAGATVMGVPAITIIGPGAAAEHSSAPIRNVGHLSASDLERDVAGHWREVLGVERVDPERSFFDVGGDSLAALRLCERMAAEYGGAVGLMDIFRFPTVRGLAQHLHERLDGHGTGSPDNERAQMRQERLRRRRTTSN